MEGTTSLTWQRALGLRGKHLNTRGRCRSHGAEARHSFRLACSLARKTCSFGKICRRVGYTAQTKLSWEIVRSRSMRTRAPDSSSSRTSQHERRAMPTSLSARYDFE